jgi:hypothetical protein
MVQFSLLFAAKPEDLANGLGDHEFFVRAKCSTSRHRSLIVRVRGLAGFINGTFVILQSERSQLCARGSVIRVKNASNSQTFRDPDEHRGVFDIDHLPRWRLGDVQRKPKDIRVGLANMNEAGRNKRIDKLVELELLNPVNIQFPCFVADHGDFQPVPHLKPTD